MDIDLSRRVLVPQQWFTPLNEAHDERITMSLISSNSDKNYADDSTKTIFYQNCFSNIPETFLMEEELSIKTVSLIYRKFLLHTKKAVIVKTKSNIKTVAVQSCTKLLVNYYYTLKPKATYKTIQTKLYKVVG